MEKKELRVLQYKVDKLRHSLHQSRETELLLNQEIEALEEELSKDNETIEHWRERGSHRTRNYRAPGNQWQASIRIKMF